MAGYFNGLLGRKITILISSLLFIIGSTILAASFSFWMLIIGRIIVGIAV
uniref:Major facilitator superfamily (MFS) profile domain-containing protein n=1 Tax=Romanomermis culicivorax TaxID=13658 RepID=A0A915KCH3_ROMCU